MTGSTCAHRNEENGLNKADLLFSRGEKCKAIKLVKSIIETGENVGECRCTLGYFYLELNDLCEAERNFYLSIEEDYSSPFARLGLASIYLTGDGASKKPGKALAILQSADRNPGVYMLIGLLRLRGANGEQRVDLAKFNFLKAYAMGNLIGYRLLAHTFWAEKKYLNAIMVEICAFCKILPIYLGNRRDIRIWAPWLNWSR